MRRSRPSSAQIRSPPLFEFPPPLALSPAEQPFRQTRLGGSWVTESETEVWSKAWSDASASRLPCGRAPEAPFRRAPLSGEFARRVARLLALFVISEGISRERCCVRKSKKKARSPPPAKSIHDSTFAHGRMRLLRLRSYSTCSLKASSSGWRLVRSSERASS